MCRVVVTAVPASRTATIEQEVINAISRTTSRGDIGTQEKLKNIRALQRSLYRFKRRCSV